MAHDVFISYSSMDKPVADAVVAALEARGVRCWIAPRDIPPGSDYGASIIEGINGSRVMVLIFSGNSNRSPQVVREVERAVNKQLHIIPFRIEPAEMTKAMEYYISSPHWLDAITPPLEAHIDHLAETVRGIIGDSAAAPRPKLTPAKISTTKAAASSDRRSPAVLLGVGIAVLALAVAGGLLWNRFHRGAAAGASSRSQAMVPPTTAPTTGPVGVRSIDALLALPATEGLVRKFELGVDDEPGSMARLFLSPDASRLVVGPHENDQGFPTAAAWDTVSGRPLFRVKGVHAIGVCGDVDKIFLATRWEGVGVRDVATGAKLCEMAVPAQDATAEWAHDGRTLAVAGDGKLAVFGSDGVKLRDLASETAEAQLWRMNFSPDDKLLVLAGASTSRVECRSPGTGALLWSQDVQVPRAMTQFAAAADRVRISRDRTWVFDARTGKPLMNLDVAWNDTLVELSPDGAWLAGASREATGEPIKLWAVDGQQELSRFNAVSVAKPTALYFTPDGRRLLVGTAEGHVLVLDMASGRQVADWKGSSSAVLGMSFSADGRFAVTNGGNGNAAWLWRIPE